MLYDEMTNSMAYFKRKLDTLTEMKAELEEEGQDKEIASGKRNFIEGKLTQTRNIICRMLQLFPAHVTKGFNFNLKASANGIHLDESDDESDSEMEDVE